MKRVHTLAAVISLFGLCGRQHLVHAVPRVPGALCSKPDAVSEPQRGGSLHSWNRKSVSLLRRLAARRYSCFSLAQNGTCSLKGRPRAYALVGNSGARGGGCRSVRSAYTRQELLLQALICKGQSFAQLCLQTCAGHEGNSAPALDGASAKRISGPSPVLGSSVYSPFSCWTGIDEMGQECYNLLSAPCTECSLDIGMMAALASTPFSLWRK